MANNVLPKQKKFYETCVNRWYETKWIEHVREAAAVTSDVWLPLMLITVN